MMLSNRPDGRFYRHLYRRLQDVLNPTSFRDFATTSGLVLRLVTLLGRPEDFFKISAPAGIALTDKCYYVN